MEPTRFTYSPIVARPRMQWPNDAQLALWIVPNIEFYEYLPEWSAQRRNPYPRCPHPDILNYGLRDYGNRVGFWRMLEVLDRHHVKCTASLNIAIYEHFPEIMRACEERQWDVMSHGMYNTQYSYGLSEDEERASIRECMATFQRLTGRQLTGWFSPADSGTLNTPDLVAEVGLRYFVGWYNDDQPFPMRVRKGQLISMPYSIDLNDSWNLIGIDTEEFLRAVMDQFDRLYQEGAESLRVMCLPLHPWVFGQPHRIKDLDRLLGYLLSHDHLWQPTAAEIADWFIANSLPVLEQHLRTSPATGQGAAR